MDDSLKALFQAYRQARVEYEMEKKVLNDLQQGLRKHESELIDYMLEHGYSKFELEGVQPVLVKYRSIRCNKENAEEIRQWLLETVGDDKDFTKAALDKSAVEELVKNMVEEGKDIPAFLGYSESPGLRVYGWDK